MPITDTHTHKQACNQAMNKYKMNRNTRYDADGFDDDDDDDVGGNGREQTSNTHRNEN